MARFAINTRKYDVLNERIKEKCKVTEAATAASRWQQEE